MAIIEKTRAIVEEDERYDGKIIPTEKAEISRPVTVEPDAIVEGGIYGETIEITDSKVTGSILAAESVDIDNGVVEDEVGSSAKITCNDATLFGSVTGKRLRLQNCVVYGNVVGDDIIIEDSLILGIVTAGNSLTIEDSICYTFKSLREAVVDGAAIVLPQAQVEGKIGFETELEVTGLGMLETMGEEHPTMDESDLVEINDSTYLSLAPRILNLKKVTERLEELEESLETVVTTAEIEDKPSPEELLETLENR